MAGLHEYEVDLRWNSERKGTLSSRVLPVQIEVATPPAYPKGEKDIWTPEHLLVAAVNACLMTTFLGIAEKYNVAFINFQNNAIGTVDEVDGKLSFTEIILRRKIQLSSLLQEVRIRRMLEMSEKACVISNSLKAKSF